MKFFRISWLFILLALLPTLAISHSGRTDSSGGHFNRKTGEYHYHNGGSPQKSSISESSQQPQSQTVYITRTGKKYHRDGCVHLKSRIAIPLKEAKARYAPCKVCAPPI